MKQQDTTKTGISERLSNLSAERRALLALKLKNKGGNEGNARKTAPETDAVIRKSGQQVNSELMRQSAQKTSVKRALPNEDAPLAFAQQRFWLLDQLYPNSPAYNMPQAVRLPGPLDAQALERSLREVAQRHEILRTTFASVDGNLKQIIASRASISLPIIDISQLSESDREAKASQLMTEESQKPFDLSNGPLLRAVLVRLDQDDHLLLLTMHHIISDGWSLAILIREVATLYSAFISGNTSPLGEPLYQYGDFARWQREWLQGEALQQQLNYWRNQLQNAQLVLDLPTDRPRPTVQSFEGARATLTLPKSLTEQVKSLSRREGVSLFMFLLAAFQTLLHRYTNQTDILIGSPIAGRNRSEFENLIGSFVNTLIFRADFSERVSFRQMLGQVRATALGAYAHQELPFEKLVEELQPNRDLSRSPLFQAMFIFQNTPLEEVNLTGLAPKEVLIENRWSTFDLNLSMIEKAQGLLASLDYNTDIFDAATMARLLGHFQTLLEAVVADPLRKVSDLPILTEGERTMLARWNDSAKELPEVLCVHSMFEAHAALAPESEAVACFDERLTYGELNRRANQLAHYLRRFGVGPDALVAVCFDRSVDMMVAMLGVLKSGASYLPLDPATPKERLAFIVKDANAQALVTQERFFEMLSQTAAHCICLDKDREQIELERGLNPAIEALPENLAYSIYTSGSTGNPKGVSITHKSVANLVSGLCPLLGLDSSDVWAAFHSTAFDFSVWDLWTPLLTGARAVIVPSSVAQSPAAFYELLATERVTVLNQTPSAFRRLLETMDDAKDLAEKLTVKHVILGGEALPRDLIGTLTEADLKVWNLYGPTEATVWASFHNVDANEGPVSIGRPLPNARLYVLDENFNPLPALIPGELHIGGDGLARGYLNNPELTAEKFIPDAESNLPGQRLYRTGDLARFLPDGKLEYLGRLDHQVKIRGYRIEPGEIESAIEKHQAVKSAVVVARAGNESDNRLVAYIVPERMNAVTVSQIRSFIQNKLPEYMIPSSFVMLNALPLTNNGKLDRKNLPAPDKARPALDSTFVAARTETETLLSKIWADVLGLEQVGVNDSFFELGGDSILGVQLLAKSGQAGLRLSPKQLFQMPTIAELAAIADKAKLDWNDRSIASESAALEGNTGGLRSDKLSQRKLALVSEKGDQIEDVYPLSPMQQGMLFHAIISPESMEYHEQMSCEITGSLDVSAFKQAWQQVINRNSALRTCFAWESSDEPVQVVCKNVMLPFESHDVSDLSEQEQHSRIQSYIATEQRRRGFDPSSAPLMRVALFHLGENHHKFVWSFHHLMIDGWSIPLVLDEARNCYAAYSQAKEPEFESKPPYKEYISWLSRQDMQEAETAWRAELKEFSAPTQIGADRAPATRFDYSDGYAEKRTRLTVARTSDLQAVARRHQITFSTLLQGAWALLLSRYSNDADIVFGSVVSGRPAEFEGAQSMVGLFINTLPVRANVSESALALDWLREFQSRQTEMRQFDYCPLAKIQRWSDVAAGTPLFESIFVYEHYPLVSSMRGQSEDAWKFDYLSEQQTGYPIHLMAVPGKELLIRLTCLKNRFDAEAMARMLGHYEQLLEGIAANILQPIRSISMLSDAERHQILRNWNDTATEFAAGDDFISTFEAQAARNPKAIAATFKGESLTYDDLNKRANRCARFFASLGVGPDVVVALFAERGLDLLTAILAVFKAGGAYLPLDPRHPAARHTMVLGASGCRFVVATGEFMPELEKALAAIDQAVRPSLYQIESIFEQQQDESNLPKQCAQENLAYIIYTSGSTGVPKGAMIEQAGMFNHLNAKVADLGLNESDIIAQTASQSFDISVWQFLAALMVGGQVRIFDDEITSDPRRLIAEADSNRISILEIVPSMMRMIIEVAGAQEPSRFDFSSLRWLVPTGEALTPETCRAWFDLFPRVPLMNAYGPTECSDDVTHAPIIDAPPESATRMQIGRPVANMQAYIIDSYQMPVAVMVSGELCIAGVGVGRGYANRPDLTAERFIPSPFSQTPGARMYKTGDVARYLPDGNIEFLGRTDNQLKIRGFRIELEEIEAALSSHDMLKDAAVLARDDKANEKRLVAYFVTYEGAVITTDELQSYLAARLPEYMIPSVYLKLDRMPLTRAGKIDRKLLPEPEMSQHSRESFIEPRTEVEQMVAGIYAEVLGADRISSNDNFFTLGGHSLTATQALSRVREVMKAELPLRSIFEAPTVAGLSEKIEAAIKSGRDAGVEPAQPVSREGELELSFGQERLWLLDQLEPNTSAYNMPTAVRLKGRLYIDALERALNEIARRHESLRTRFAQIDGRPIQIIDDAKPRILEVTDLSALPESERQAQLGSLTTKEAQRPFDLSQGPLMRSKLIKMSEREHVFLLTLHHIVSDGWSMRILVQELTDIYRAYSKGEPHTLADLPIQYADYAAWQRKQLNSEGHSKQLDYWKKNLAGELTILELPASRVRPAVRTFRSATETMQLPTDAVKRLRELSQQESVTMFMTLLAAFKVLLHRYSGQEEILVGTPIAGRATVEVEKMIGFFLNTLVIRSNLSGNPSFRDVLKQVRETCLGAYANQDIAFEKLVEELQPERNLSRTPIFQVFFNMLNIPGERKEMSEMELVMQSLDQIEIGSKFDITLYVAEQGESARLSLVYNADLFEADSMKEMLEQYSLILAQATASPRENIGSYSLVTNSAEKALPDLTQSLTRSSQTAVHKLFSQQAKQNPSAVAISEAGQKWSYEGLDKASNRVANRLIENGLNKGEIVAIYAVRSSALVTSALAALKAGAAFVMIDPAHPASRAVECLKQANPVVFINARQSNELPEEMADYFKTASIRVEVWQSLDEDNASRFESISTEYANAETAAKDLAYIAFTSGSTGTAKGVIGTHEPLAHFINWHERTFQLTRTDRYSMLSGVSHDPLLRDIFTPLCSGATLSIPGDDDLSSGARLAKWMKQEAISVVHLTPAMAQLLTETQNDDRSDKDVLPSLRYAFFGADLLSVGDVTKLKELAPAVTCINFYGATETPQAMSYHVISDDRDSSDRANIKSRQVVSLGRGIEGVQLLVLNAAGKLAGIGERGEIYVRTPYLTEGYLNDTDLTAKRFVVNPFTNIANDKLYKTGDLGFYMPSGDVQPLGRADRQVKVRGYRIELAEIEAALREHHLVNDITVAAKDNGTGQKKIVAYIVPRETPPTASELNNFLKKRLPDYMIPSAFMMLESIPLTPNGKIDWRALPDADGSRPELETGFVAPRTPEQSMIAQIWSEVLGVERIGIHDNFFHLGGHSLLAMQVMSRAQDYFEVELSLRRLFENPTIAELAMAIEEARLIQQRIDEEEFLKALAEFSEEELLATVDEMRRERIL